MAARRGYLDATSIRLAATAGGLLLVALGAITARGVIAAWGAVGDAREVLQGTGGPPAWMHGLATPAWPTATVVLCGGGLAATAAYGLLVLVRAARAG